MYCYDRWTKAQLVDYYVKLADGVIEYPNYRDAAAFKVCLDCVGKALEWLDSMEVAL